MCSSPKGGEAALTFHADIFLPAGLRLPSGILELRYTQHALDAATKDRYADVSAMLPRVIDVEQAKLVEVATDRRLKPLKAVYRVGLTATLDLALVLILDPAGPTRVATVWCNRHDDKHSTLRVERYWQAYA